MADLFHVGTSGWAYDDWQGSFYPKGVRGADRLGYYAERFDTVEVNATFYRLPFRSMITAWNCRLPPSFRLAVKGPRVVTHFRRLLDCREPLKRFFDRVLQLHALRVILWQLPPGLERDLGRLESFLGQLPEGVRHAIEFRHPSWWDARTDALLSRHQAAFVAVSHPRLPDNIRPTADFLYLRFHGLGKRLYDYDYSENELRSWRDRLHAAIEDRPLYAYFNNDCKARAPRNASALRQMLQAG